MLPANCIDANGEWLTFHVPTVREGQWIYKDRWGTEGAIYNNEPRQGNAVIAVKDASGTTMWSYHIWVTDYVPKNYPGYGNQAGQDYIDCSANLKLRFDGLSSNPRYQQDSVMHFRHITRHLGRTVYGRSVKVKYGPDSVYVKLVQTEGPGLSTVMKVRQELGIVSDTLDRSQPYFQYGRSTAFWPSNGIDDTEPTWYGKTPKIVTTAGPVDLPVSIKNPDKYVAAEAIVLNGTPVNIQNAYQRKISQRRIILHNEGNDTDVNNYTLTNIYLINRNDFVNDKTIFDPNPVGYSLPPIFVRFCYRNEISDNHSDAPSVRLIMGQENQKISFDIMGYKTYTDVGKTSIFTYPITGKRGKNGSMEGMSIVAGYMADSYFDNSINTSPDLTAAHIGVSTTGDYSINFWYRRGYGAGPVLPFDDAVRNSKEFIENYYSYVIDTWNSGSSPAPSASSSLGRYTVMATDPGLQ